MRNWQQITKTWPFHGYTHDMPQPEPVIETLDDQTAEILRQQGSAERLEMAFGMWRSARELITSILTAEHPDWTEDEVASEVARRLSHGAC
jgi:hypothetical protein